MKVLAVITLLVILLFVVLPAQEIRVKVIDDFSGGLVNSISNAAMRDNQATVLLNYDINPYGNFKRRQGLISFGGYLERIYGIFPYITNEKRELLLLMQEEDSSYCKITRCDFATGLCTTKVLDRLYYPSTDWKVPFGKGQFMFNDKLYFAVTNSEMMTYDGTNLIPVRPRAHGQVHVVPINGVGEIKGTVRYKFCFIDTTANDTSNFSPPTWSVSVNYGNVSISDIWAPIDTTKQDKLLIFREKDLDGNYEHLVTLANDVTSYTDTTNSTSSADTTRYSWGRKRHCCGTDDDRDVPAPAAFLLAPGAMTISLVAGNDTVGHGKPDDQNPDTSKYFYMSWSIVFVDSAGRHSYMSTPTCIGKEHKYTANYYEDLNYHAELTDIPLPHDSGITSKLLLRMHANDQYSQHQHTDSLYLNRYIVIDTLEPDSTTYTDSTSYFSTKNLSTYSPSGGTCSGRLLADTLDYDSNWAHFLRYDSIGDIQELACYDDSVISFTPSGLIYSGNRAYVIGNPQMTNALFYSRFGKFATWPDSQFIGFPTLQGDWPTGLLQIEDAIIIFRQSSIWRLTGQTFYQFSLDQVIDNVGLTAPRSVARVGNDIYFYHSSGVYRMSQFGGLSNEPITMIIQKSLDSFMVNQQRAVGASVNDEYWFCIDYTSNYQTTYIYSEAPLPHWRAYDFGFHQIVHFDTDTLSGTFNPNRWLIALIDNIGNGGYLYKWETDNLSGYVNVDTMDVYITNTPETSYIAIKAVYQSKRFFEGREREKIFWLDIVGEGACSTITFTFYDEGVAFDSVNFVPDFTDGIRDRIIVDHIVSDFAVRWRDNGYGQYTIKGYEIGWIPWDRGRPVP